LFTEFINYDMHQNLLYHPPNGIQVWHIRWWHCGLASNNSTQHLMIQNRPNEEETNSAVQFVHCTLSDSDLFKIDSVSSSTDHILFFGFRNSPLLVGILVSF